MQIAALLVVGTLMLWGGRAYVQLLAGVPPKPWLVMEILVAAGPAFGWYSYATGASVGLWISGLWALLGLVFLAVSLYVARQYKERKMMADQVVTKQEDEFSGETNPMVRSYRQFQSIDRTFDEELVDNNLKSARRKRDRIATAR